MIDKIDTGLVCVWIYYLGWLECSLSSYHVVLSQAKQ